jgi:hypothetical protein
MDTGEILFAFCRLFFSAAAAFFAITLWSKSRDIVWMLMAGGTVTAYGESLYTVLGFFGISAFFSALESMSPLAAALSNIPVLFFIAAFAVALARSYGRREGETRHNPGQS